MQMLWCLRKEKVLAHKQQNISASRLLLDEIYTLNGFIMDFIVKVGTWQEFSLMLRHDLNVFFRKINSWNYEKFLKYFNAWLFKIKEYILGLEAVDERQGERQERSFETVFWIRNVVSDFVTRNKNKSCVTLQETFKRVYFIFCPSRSRFFNPTYQISNVSVSLNSFLLTFKLFHWVHHRHPFVWSDSSENVKENTKVTCCLCHHCEK